MKVHKTVTDNQDVVYQMLDENNAEIQPVNGFLFFLRIKNFSPNTIKNYAFDLKSYLEYLQQIQKLCTDVTVTDITNFMGYLADSPGRRKKQRAPSTRKRMLAAIASFYDWLEFQENGSGSHALSTTTNRPGYPTKSPYRGLLSFAKKQNQLKTKMIKIKAPKPLPKSISEKDIQLLLPSLKTWRDKAILFLGLQTGMRIGEILGLCFGDVNFRKREIKICFRKNPNEARVKGMYDRMIYIEEPEALSCLNNYILYERPANDCPYIFLVNKGKTSGKPLTYQGIYTVFEYYCSKLGIKNKFSLHRLRHTHATTLYEKGMGLLSLQKRLGHASPQTTQIYAQVSDSKLKEEYLNAIRNK